VAVHALIFRRRVYAKAAEYDRTAQIPRLAKVAAGLSLLLWPSLVCAGRWIAYYEPENESGRRSISPQTPERMRIDIALYGAPVQSQASRGLFIAARPAENDRHIPAK